LFWSISWVWSCFGRPRSERRAKRSDKEQPGRARMGRGGGGGGRVPAASCCPGDSPARVRGEGRWSPRDSRVRGWNGEFAGAGAEPGEVRSPPGPDRSGIARPSSAPRAWGSRRPGAGILPRPVQSLAGARGCSCCPRDLEVEPADEKGRAPAGQALLLPWRKQSRCGFPAVLRSPSPPEEVFTAFPSQGPAPSLIRASPGAPGPPGAGCAPSAYSPGGVCHCVGPRRVWSGAGGAQPACSAALAPCPAPPLDLRPLVVPTKVAASWARRAVTDSGRKAVCPLGFPPRFLPSGSWTELIVRVVHWRAGRGGVAPRGTATYSFLQGRRAKLGSLAFKAVVAVGLAPAARYRPAPEQRGHARAWARGETPGVVGMRGSPSLSGKRAGVPQPLGQQSLDRQRRSCFPFAATSGSLGKTLRHHVNERCPGACPAQGQGRTLVEKLRCEKAGGRGFGGKEPVPRGCSPSASPLVCLT